MKMMRPVAQSDGGRSILLETAPGRGRVLSLRRNVIYPDFSIDSILARGYWEPFSGDERALLEAVSAADEYVDPRPRRPRAAA